MGFFFITSVSYAKSETSDPLDDWDLIWQDEFDSSIINTSDWGLTWELERLFLKHLEKAHLYFHRKISPEITFLYGGMDF